MEPLSVALYIFVGASQPIHVYTFATMKECHATMQHAEPANGSRNGVVQYRCIPFSFTWKD